MSWGFILDLYFSNKDSVAGEDVTLVVLLGAIKRFYGDGRGVHHNIRTSLLDLRQNYRTMSTL